MRTRLETLKSSESGTFQKFLQQFKPFQDALDATQPKLYGYTENDFDPQKFERMIKYLEEFERFCRGGDLLSREFPQGLKNDPTWVAIRDEDEARAEAILKSFSDMTLGGLTLQRPGRETVASIPQSIEDLESLFIALHGSGLGDFLARANSEQGIMLSYEDLGFQFALRNSCEQKISISPNAPPRWKELKKIEARLHEISNSDDTDMAAFLRSFRPFRATMKGVQDALKTNPSEETLARFQAELEVLEQLEGLFKFKDEMIDRFPASLDADPACREVLSSNPELVFAVTQFSDELREDSHARTLKPSRGQSLLNRDIPSTYEALDEGVSVSLATWRDSKAIETFLEKLENVRRAKADEDVTTPRERLLASAARLNNASQIARAFSDNDGNIQMNAEQLSELRMALEEQMAAIPEEMSRLINAGKKDPSMMDRITGFLHEPASPSAVTNRVRERMTTLLTLLEEEMGGIEADRGEDGECTTNPLDARTAQFLMETTRELAGYEALLFSMHLHGEMRQLGDAGGELAVLHRLNRRISDALDSGRKLDSENAIALGRQVLTEIDRNALRLSLDPEIAFFSDPAGVTKNGFKDWQIAFGGGGLHPKYYEAAVKELKLIKKLLAEGRHEEAQKRYARFAASPLHQNLIKYLNAYQGIERGKELLGRLAIISAAAFASGLATAALAPYLKGTALGDIALMFAEGVFFIGSEKIIEVAVTWKDPLEGNTLEEKLKNLGMDVLFMGPMLRYLKKVGKITDDALNAFLSAATKEDAIRALPKFVAEFIAFTAWETAEGNARLAFDGRFDPQAVSEQVYSLEGSENRFVFLLGLKLGHYVMNPITSPIGRHVYTAIERKQMERFNANRKETAGIMDAMGRIGKEVKGEANQRRALNDSYKKLESLYRKQLGILRALRDVATDGENAADLDEAIARHEAIQRKARTMRREGAIPKRVTGKDDSRPVDLSARAEGPARIVAREGEFIVVEDADKKLETMQYVDGALTDAKGNYYFESAGLLATKGGSPKPAKIIAVEDGAYKGMEGRDMPTDRVTLFEIEGQLHAFAGTGPEREPVKGFYFAGQGKYFISYRGLFDVVVVGTGATSADRALADRIRSGAKLSTVLLEERDGQFKPITNATYPEIGLGTDGNGLARIVNVAGIESRRVGQGKVEVVESMPESLRADFGEQQGVTALWPKGMQALFWTSQSARVSGLDLGCPRFDENLRGAEPSARVQRWNRAMAGFQRISEVVGDGMGVVIEQMARWPEEYQLRYLEKMGEDPDLHNKRGDILGFVECTTEWIDSFSRPVAQGSGWRRISGTEEDVRRFNDSFRPAQQGYTETTINDLWKEKRHYSASYYDNNYYCDMPIGYTLRANNGALEKAEAWAREMGSGDDVNRDRIWFETHGYLVVKTDDDSRTITIEDFIPVPTVNADVWLRSEFENKPLTLSSVDIFPAKKGFHSRGAFGELFPEVDFTMDSPRASSSIRAPEGYKLVDWHSHPLNWSTGSDRPSYGDFSTATVYGRLDYMASVWTPEGGHYLYPAGENSRRPESLEGYYRMPIEDLERQGLVQRVPAVIGNGAGPDDSKASEEVVRGKDADGTQLDEDGMGYSVSRGLFDSNTFTKSTPFGRIEDNIRESIKEKRAQGGAGPIRILTIGAGEGRLEAELKKMFGSDIEIDIFSLTSLLSADARDAIGREYLGNLDVKDLPRGYDRIISIYGTNNAANQPRVLDQIIASLNAGGEAVFFGSTERGNGRVSMDDSSELQEALRSQGFDVAVFASDIGLLLNRVVYLKNNRGAARFERPGPDGAPNSGLHFQKSKNGPYFLATSENHAMQDATISGIEEALRRWGYDVDGIKSEEPSLLSHLLQNGLYAVLNGMPVDMAVAQMRGNVDKAYSGFEDYKLRPVRPAESRPTDTHTPLWPLPKPGGPIAADGTDGRPPKVRIPGDSESGEIPGARMRENFAPRTRQTAFETVEVGPEEGPARLSSENIKPLRLSALSGDGNKNFSIRGRPEVTIGEGSGNTLQISAPGMAGRPPVELMWFAFTGVWALKPGDGVRLNGRPLRYQTAIKNGNRITAGDGFEWIVGKTASRTENSATEPRPVAEPAPKSGTVSETEETQEARAQTILKNPRPGTMIYEPPTDTLGETAAISGPGRSPIEVSQDGVQIITSRSGSRHLVDHDGIGGKKELGGEISAEIAAAEFERVLSETDDHEAAFNAAHTRIKDETKKAGVATVSVEISPSASPEAPAVARYFWAGDARAVHLRMGADGRYRVIYRTWDDSGSNGMIRQGGSVLSRETVDDGWSSIENHIGMSWPPGGFRFGPDEMVVRKTEDGLIADDEAEAEYRMADEFGEGIILQGGDLIITGSDGLWENLMGKSVAELEGEINEIIADCNGAEEIAKALNDEASYRQKVFIQTLSRPEIINGGRAPIQYEGRISSLKARTLYMDSDGRLFESPDSKDRNKVGTLKGDHLSVGIYLHNPRSVARTEPNLGPFDFTDAELETRGPEEENPAMTCEEPVDTRSTEQTR